jgi:hypothetical protein
MVMAERNGCFGGIFGDDTILWFIILFLLLFCGCGGIGCKD